MEVPEESFHWSSWDSRTCYPRRAFIQGLTDDKLERRLTLARRGQVNESKVGVFSWSSRPKTRGR